MCRRHFSLLHALLYCKCTLLPLWQPAYRFISLSPPPLSLFPLSLSSSISLPSLPPPLISIYFSATWLLIYTPPLSLATSLTLHLSFSSSLSLSLPHPNSFLFTFCSTLATILPLNVSFSFSLFFSASECGNKYWI